MSTSCFTWVDSELGWALGRLVIILRGREGESAESGRDSSAGFKRGHGCVQMLTCLLEGV